MPPLNSNEFRAPGAPCATRLESATDQLRLIAEAMIEIRGLGEIRIAPPSVVGRRTTPIVAVGSRTCPTPVESRSTVMAPS